MREMVVLALFTTAVCACGSDDPEGYANGTSGAAGAGGDSFAGAGGGAGTSAGGDAGVGGTGGTEAGPCDEACRKQVELNCSAGPSTAECTAKCLENLQAMTACRSAGEQALACAAGPGIFACNSSGSPELSGCDGELLAVVVCGVCQPDPNDDACKQCWKPECCDEMRAIASDPDLDAFVECSQACTDDPCRENCASTYPSVVAATVAANTCRKDMCGTVCSE